MEGMVEQEVNWVQASMLSSGVGKKCLDLLDCVYYNYYQVEALVENLAT